MRQPANRQEFAGVAEPKCGDHASADRAGPGESAAIAWCTGVPAVFCCSAGTPSRHLEKHQAGTRPERPAPA
jgi:hypothetical protein